MRSSGHVRLHHHIVHLVVEALRRTPSWGAVEAEAVVERGRGALRPDLRATHASSGAVVWADASVTAPFGPRTTAPTAASPLRAVAAEARERAKVAKYANALPGPPASHTFTPLVWEAYGRIGPATAKWLRGAMRGPALSGVRSTLLTRVSVALWRSHSRAVSLGYSRCFGIAGEDPEGGRGGLLDPRESSDRFGERIGE
ncbi:hypothetical protein MMPV_000772 [Pyropia vietnamensis]